MEINTIFFKVFHTKYIWHKRRDYFFVKFLFLKKGDSFLTFSDKNAINTDKQPFFLGNIKNLFDDGIKNMHKIKH